MLTTDDRREITDTLALHAHIVDSNQLERLDELFTPDAVYDMTRAGFPLIEGIDAIRAAAARMAHSGHAPLVHYVTNIVLSGGGHDTAAALSNGLMIMGDGGVLGVTHQDTLRRHDGHWRISSRTIVPARSATVPAGGGNGNRNGDGND